MSDQQQYLAALPPRITNPGVGHTLPLGSSYTFKWSDNGTDVDNYTVLIAGNNSGHTYASLGNVQNTQVTINNIGVPTPTDTALDVTFTYTINGTSYTDNYSYTIQPFQLITPEQAHWYPVGVIPIEWTTKGAVTVTVRNTNGAIVFFSSLSNHTKTVWRPDYTHPDISPFTFFDLEIVLSSPQQTINTAFRLIKPTGTHLINAIPSQQSEFSLFYNTDIYLYRDGSETRNTRHVTPLIQASLSYAIPDGQVEVVSDIFKHGRDKVLMPFSPLSMCGTTNRLGMTDIDATAFKEQFVFKCLFILPNKGSYFVADAMNIGGTLRVQQFLPLVVSQKEKVEAYPLILANPDYKNMESVGKSASVLSVDLMKTGFPLPLSDTGLPVKNMGIYGTLLDIEPSSFSGKLSQLVELSKGIENPKYTVTGKKVSLLTSIKYIWSSQKMLASLIAFYRKVKGQQEPFLVVDYQTIFKVNSIQGNDLLVQYPSPHTGNLSELSGKMIGFFDERCNLLGMSEISEVANLNDLIKVTLASQPPADTKTISRVIKVRISEDRLVFKVVNKDIGSCEIPLTEVSL